MHHKQKALLFSKESNESNKNDQYVVYLELCLISLFCKMIYSLYESFGKTS